MRLQAAAAAGLLVIGACVVASGDRRSPVGGGAHELVERACSLPAAHLRAIAAGYRTGVSEEIVLVPRAPNYVGSFLRPSHSGPWDYLQRVPLVLYSPSHIEATGSVARRVDLRDVYPTAAELVGVDLPARDGTILGEGLRLNRSPPRLIVTVVWDGVGANVLRRWPQAWPNLARLARTGVSYTGAVVGSSPSITPATHTTLGTGVFPRRHGITGIQMRRDGELTQAFRDGDPTYLGMPTFAEEIDHALGGRPLVGLLGWQSWHLGLVGGRRRPGGDEAVVGMFGARGGLAADASAFDVPHHASDATTLRRYGARLDRTDGRLDRRWAGGEILADKADPAWARYQTHVLARILRREGFGADRVPDLFFTNYKMTDVIGHRRSMDSPVMRTVLHAQDRELLRLKQHLDRTVGRYVLVVTADHGSTPSPERTGAWPIEESEVIADLDRRFDVPRSDSLVEEMHAAGIFLDASAMEKAAVTDTDVARYLGRYRISDNATEELPARFASQAGERVFAAVIPGRLLGDGLICR